MDRRHLLRAAALGTAAGLAGCGVASRNGVVVDGPGPPVGKGSTTPKREPLSRSVASDPKSLLQGLFSQAAWDLNDPNPALVRWRSYFVTSSDATQGVNTTVTVVFCDFDKVRTLLQQGEQTTLVLPVVPLGVLGADGRVTPNVSSSAYELTFLIGPAATDPKSKNDKSLYVLDMYIDDGRTADHKTKRRPKTMLLSSDALGSYYEYRNVYFWEKGLTCLVPDGRYVPTAWEDADRRKRLAEWVFGDPPAWLRGAVDLPAPNVKVLDIPSAPSQRLVVNLSADVTKKGTLDRVVSQLTWTLLPEISHITSDLENSPVTLKIESNERRIEHPYAADNATGVRTRNAQAIEAFAILEGKVVRLQRSFDRSPDLPGLLKSSPEFINTAVQWAALARNANATSVEAAAVVRTQSGRPRLYLGPPRADVVALSEIDLPAATTMLQPAFLDSLNLLVVADGQLYNVRRTGGKVTDLELGGVQAFAVPPDGRRIAYISGGKLFVRSLLVNAAGVALGTPVRQLRAVLTDLTGVAFTAENWLAVSGSYDGKIRVVEMSIDGGRVGADPDISQRWLGGGKDVAQPITSLTAYPDSAYPSNTTTKRVYATTGEKAAAKAVNATSNFDPLTTELVVPAPSGESAVHPFFLQ